MKFIREYREQQDQIKKQQLKEQVIASEQAKMLRSTTKLGYKSLYGQYTSRNQPTESPKNRYMNKQKKTKTEEEKNKQEFIDNELRKKQKINPNLIDSLNDYIRQQQNMMELREYQRDKDHYNVMFKTVDENEIFGQNLKDHALNKSRLPRLVKLNKNQSNSNILNSSYISDQDVSRFLTNVDRHTKRNERKNKSLYSSMRRSMQVVDQQNKKMLDKIENASDDSIDFEELNYDFKKLKLEAKSTAKSNSSLSKSWIKKPNGQTSHPGAYGKGAKMGLDLEVQQDQMLYSQQSELNIKQPSI
ncbi:UNKNOWN [Stylonychia lemnae]|uniref:Uncharacterized protein n=1 Tax=Stylonychia lemnae TaxID=5949 RepID=A0A078A4Z9_STYLE|nr:UNKNOWN [Stylonychia lemnae]|eukprot:CDW77340.1 UNKNOWN [Stylonychia lemnae]